MNERKLEHGSRINTAGERSARASTLGRHSKYCGHSDGWPLFGRLSQMRGETVLRDQKIEVEYWRGHQHPFIPLGGPCYGAIPTQTKKSSSDASWGDAPRHESRMCSSSQQNFGRLLSHAEPNYSGCCATFGPGGSLKGSRTFLANGRNKYFAIIARDGVSRPFDVTQSACLPGIAFRAWRPRRTGWALGTRRS